MVLASYLTVYSLMHSVSYCLAELPPVSPNWPAIAVIARDRP